MVNGNGRVEPFDSFRLLYKILIWVGVARLLDNPRSRIKFVLHQIYRPLTFLIIINYNMQHLIFIIMTKDDAETMFEGVIMLIPSINLAMKFCILNYGNSRLVKLRELLNGPIFAPKHEKDEEYLMKHTKHLTILVKVINLATAITAFFWALMPFAKRIQGADHPVPSYVPFETNSTRGFTGAWFIEIGPVMWSAFGHINLDILIVAYYAQSKVQLQIIKYNLENICDSEVKTMNVKHRKFQYKDHANPNIQERFVHCVQRFEKVVWYTNEVTTVFNIAVSFQFYTTSVAICLVIYKMSMTVVTSLQFIFLSLLFFMLQTQVFLYCYYGGLVHYESLSVANAIFMSDWVSLSPRFRRQLVIAMVRWSQPIKPQVSFIIPLSLSTYITILKSAYTLFTVLKTTPN